jgi:hypothetical protein
LPTALAGLPWRGIWTIVTQRRDRSDPMIEVTR